MLIDILQIGLHSGYMGVVGNGKSKIHGWPGGWLQVRGW